MTKHFHRELAKIKKKLLALGTMVEERVRMAVQATDARDAELAKHIIQLDHEIDEMEVEVEEECLKILALYQPVAVDLRFLVAVIKITNELERIGDQAVNIAQRVEVIGKFPADQIHFDHLQMAEKSQSMLKASLDALVNLDIDLAFKVLTMDDEVDAIQKNAYDIIKAKLGEQTDQIGFLINQLLVSRHLERLADHATNIAEEVIYLIEGEIIRHGKF
jgi:phosphate transport system protein